MDMTPKAKQLKLSCRRDTRSAALATSSPISTARNTVKDEESPNFFAFSQEGNDDIDVVWDWNSPQAKKRTRVSSVKNKVLSTSPKLTLKRHPSNNQVQYDKLKEELQELRDQIARAGEEDCLSVSPLEENHLRDLRNGFGNNSQNNSSIHELVEDQQKFNYDFNNDFDDLFDESMDEQLLLCTQQVENKLLKETKIETTKVGTKEKEKSVSAVPNVLKSIKTEEYSMNDSFDLLVQKFGDKDIELLSQRCIKKDPNEKNSDLLNSSFKRTVSDINVQYGSNSNSKQVTNPAEFPRTQSFEHPSTSSTVTLSKEVLEEIEKKRQEALAKRKARLKNTQTDNSVNTSNNNLPKKCTAAEIEHKRLMALKKLEEKKQQEIIEKNRQEALRRLNLSKQKRMNKLNG